MAIQQTKTASRPAEIQRDSSIETTLATIVLVADSADFDLLVVTGAKAVSFFSSFLVTGDAEARMFEDTEVSDPGAAQTLVNRDRTSSAISTVTMFTGPTVTDDGTQLAEVLLPGGSDKNASKNFGADLEVDPYVLKPNTNYLFRLTNLTSSTVAVSGSITFVEDENS